jgi:hypothetical protein
MERWFKLEFKEIPRTWTKKQWKEACRFQRTLTREMHKTMDKEAIDREIATSISDLLMFGTCIVNNPLDIPPEIE